MAARTDEEWLTALRNEGSAEQAHAFEDLGRFLYRVVYNYLLKRQGDIFHLSSLANSELAELAHEFVQRALVTIWQKLDKYGRRGRFTSFAAVIATREAGQELRKGYWRRRVCLPTRVNQREEDDEIQVEDVLSYLALGEIGQSLCGEQRVQLGRIMEIVRRTVYEVFSAAQRGAFAGRFFLEKTCQELAETLGCTRNRVYGLIHECRAILKCRLEDADYTFQDIYAIFEKGSWL
jgi:RNA polymerase sigma factor (sigma-70 family)